LEKVISEISSIKMKTVYFEKDAMTINLPIKLSHLPNSLPLDGAVRIELVEGVPNTVRLSPKPDKMGVITQMS